MCNYVFQQIAIILNTVTETNIFVPPNCIYLCSWRLATYVVCQRRRTSKFCTSFEKSMYSTVLKLKIWNIIHMSYYIRSSPPPLQKSKNANKRDQDLDKMLSSSSAPNYIRALKWRQGPDTWKHASTCSFIPDSLYCHNYFLSAYWAWDTSNSGQLTRSLLNKLLSICYSYTILLKKNFSTLWLHSHV